MLPSDPGWFVDVGCGYGRLLPVYRRPGRQLVLVDYAVNLLEMAAETHGTEQIFYVAADAYKTPFRDEVFRAGLCVRTFHHMNAPRAFLNEFARIIGKGSSVVLSYSNKRNLFRILKHGRRSFRRNHEEYEEMLFGTHPDYFAKISDSAGFSVQRVRGTGFVDQVLTASGSLEGLLNKMPFLRPPLAWGERIADFAISGMGLAPLSFALLRKETGNGNISGKDSQGRNFIDILACPSCRAPKLKEKLREVACSGCGSAFPKIGNIFDFRGGLNNEEGGISVDSLRH
jgi:Methyltransferase domain